ncbi:hypothetical protein EUGRSUZ_F00174 [Eucalyptus grandis]|uniref:Uncharacterized protein n=2 Tax=Eucalyptus grandis TaxID=71139 RepID=A0ACC3KB18_EUCGR|nr:hypothetical protein EUGRSUZ_F00174 [Eucalyptus grandis]
MYIDLAFDDVVRVALREHRLDHCLALLLSAAVGIASLPSRPVLIYHPLQDHIGPVGHVHHPPLSTLEVHHLPQHRQEIARVRSAQLEFLLYQLPVLPRHLGVASVDGDPRVALPRDHPHDDVEGQLLQPRTHLHPRKTTALGGGGRLVEAPREVPDLLLPDGEGAGEAVRRKDLHGREAAEVAPVGAVGGAADGGVAVSHDLARERAGAVGEGDVVPGEALLSRGRGGYDDRGPRAQGEGEDRAIAVGEGLKGAVDRLFYEVEVADDGE